MAFKPLLPKTEYMRPIPDYSEIQAASSTGGIPVPATPAHGTVSSQAGLMELFHKPEVWLILITAASEIIGCPRCGESLIQLVLSFLKSAAKRGR